MEQVGSDSVDRTRALYERPVLEVHDEAAFRAVRNAVTTSFADAGIRDFLRTLDKAGLRIRNFEAVLKAGKLGSGTSAQYFQLSPSDQGQIRELYLASLEQVTPSLRDRFFKLYAYY